MKLYLVQHGDALAKDEDPKRPLSERGRAEVTAMGKFLEGRMHVSRVVHSGKTRARQTAEILAGIVAPGKPIAAVEGMKPKDAALPFYEQLLDWQEDLLVVGHLPFMAKLAAHLITGSEDAVVTAYQPGSVVCIVHDGDDWQIQWMLRPELLGS